MMRGPASGLAARQTQILFENTRFSALPALAAGLVFASLFLKTVPAAPILSWLGAYLVAIVAREGIQFGYARATPGRHHRFLTLTRLWALFVGGIWAAGVIVVADAASPELRLFAAFWVAGVTGAGCFAFSIDLSTALAYFFPGAAASVWMLARSGGESAAFFALGVTMYFTYTLYLAIRSHRAMLREISLRIHNLTLMESVRNERDRAEQLNDEIQAEVERRAEAERALREAYERAERLSASDPLTGIANRREFDRVLEREFARARRDRQPLSLVIVDIDYFKPFNDYYGHPAGDRCLQRVAAILDGHARRGGDLAARYGGEEFVLLLPGTNEPDALDIAERLRCAVAGAGLEHKASPLAPTLTASLGIATLVPTGEQRPAMLVAAADLALYRAKDEGRNRVAVYSESVARLSEVYGAARLFENID